MPSKKIAFIVILGNVLEYYDFLLFAHVGFIITPLFFPSESSTYTHILSLLLFGLSFITRPIGGYIFGKIADAHGRRIALIKSVKWAVAPAIGFALLPGYEHLGVISSLIFVILRLMQGIALGGEYPVGGTYLMETYKTNQGLLSSVFLVAGGIGSILGLGFAALCIQPDMPKWLWRAAFLLGGVGVFVSYYMRKYLNDFYLPTKVTKDVSIPDINLRRCLVFAISTVAGAIMWIPMTYSNFYITKILGFSSTTGIYATFVALVTYILLLPFVGIIFDRVNHRKFLLWSIFIICPLSMISLYLLSKGHIEFAQIGLVIAVSFIGAPVHQIFNSIFPMEMRGRNIGIIFMAGLSFGGILPSLSGYIVSKTNFILAPAALVSIVAVFSFIFVYKYIDKLKPVTTEKEV